MGIAALNMENRKDAASEDVIYRISNSIGISDGSAKPVVSVAIADLLPADSPRLTGENAEHIIMLADSGMKLPPIIVHRTTMRVIDGMHRLGAALRRGSQRIDALLVDNTEEEDLFILTVQANIAHGLPLTLADRQSAAARIILSHSQWSDRSIAKVTGLAPKTVRAIREQTPGASSPSHVRLGQDGKARPLTAAVGRKRAGEILTANPGASLRQVAKDAGISLGTAFDVRKRLVNGEEPVVPPEKCGPPQDGEQDDPPEHLKKNVRRARIDEPSSTRVREGGLKKQVVTRDPSMLINVLMRDPSLRFTDSGRLLLRWLSSRGISPAEYGEMIESVPPHCTGAVVDYARLVAEFWTQFADQLDQRERAMA
ncbi:ParB-like nuclease family protein [Streptomyces sp. BK022]|uniref:ParB/RepB/Spo0J family partition protein n=1 Tax=Streptomyces sp. BK022 TaxID=2512123 RepID=UPI0010299BDF|nr:ParB/RepB/Spo0J family partition protein [Streptomyces sp. BK022]RZU45727.1 ParB-like nuclease family protein [Streptomyces sp. BK022]